MEILAPCGNMQNLITAINAGADAVYLGLKNFSARKSAENFDFDNLLYAISYAKTFNVKVYLTINTLIKDSELDNFFEIIKKAYSYGVDAFILQDIFLGKVIKTVIPSAVLHLSTQAGVCNEYGAKLALKYGFNRVILARETTLDDIKKISNIIETEVFIQGALCTSFSGHCYFSSFIGGNSGNRGFCKQPCRKPCFYNDGKNKLTSGYSLSLSDLMVGDKILRLKELGVKSFKIEGRLRSQEYVASAILYYKSILSKNENNTYKTALYKSFNRGDYTSGLAFGQDENFISSKIQSHKGYFVGKITKIINNSILFSNSNNYKVNDSFKILRNGKEVGSAICDGKTNFSIKYKGKIAVGDDVFITKQTNLLETLNIPKKLKNITVNVCVKVGDKLSLESNGVIIYSNEIVETATSLPLTKNEVISNLNKTDIYPFNINVNFNYFDNNAFVLKSTLNKLRAELYRRLFYVKLLNNCDNFDKYSKYSILENKKIISNKNVVITSKILPINNLANVVYAPTDYNRLNEINICDFKTEKVWLYLPPYLSGNDLSIILPHINKFYGIYCDGYYGLQLMHEFNFKLFAGTGFNVFNKIAYTLLCEENVEYITASKELSKTEILNISKSLYVLNNSNLQIMDLIYCPLNKNCKNCNVNDIFTLKDEQNREFKVQRYKISTCRFKVFNPYNLKFNLNMPLILDLTLQNENFIRDLLSDKAEFTNTTKGNYPKGIQ